MHDLAVPVERGDLAVPVDSGEFNVWYREAKAGSPTVVLIHGLTGNSRWWTPVISHLPSDLGLIALDVRGRGASWDAPGPYDLKTIADDVARCLDHLGVESGTVVGYSMGAWVANLIGKHRPDRADRLVLVDGGLPIEFDKGLDTEAILDQIVGPSLQRISMEFDTIDDYLGFFSQHPALVERWDSTLETFLSYDVHQVGNMWRPRANREAIIQAGYDLTLDPETVSAWREVEAPTTLLVVDHGMTDQSGGFIRLETAQEAVAANANIRLRLLEGLNHYTLMFGDGAPLVAEAIVGDGSYRQV